MLINIFLLFSLNIFKLLFDINNLKILNKYNE